jgi:glycosyltransferase involved in cell wall biosynthesis
LLKHTKYSVCHLLYEEFPRDPRVRHYVKALNESGINCIVVCSKKPGEGYYEVWNNNLIYRIPVSKKRRSFFFTLIEYSVFTFVSSFLLIYLGLKHGFEILQVHTLPDFLIFAGLWNKIFGCKLILDLHELFPEIFMARKPELQNSFYVKILKLSEKLSIKLADKAITIHDNAKDIFIRRNPGLEKKITVIMNGVDENEIKSRERNLTDNFIILYNGSLVKLLNLQLVVKSLALLKEKMPSEDFNKITFSLYGDGPGLKDITEEARVLGLSDKIFYGGYIPPVKIYDEILKANVCILPPLKNLYSDLFYTVKMVEMIYLKVPVIATRLKTYLLYYSENSIFYFDSNNIEELSERIKEVFYNKESVQKKIESAFADYQKVGWGIMKKRYVDLINITLN